MSNDNSQHLWPKIHPKGNLSFTTILSVLRVYTNKVNNIRRDAQARASFLSATASRPSPLDGRLAVVHEIFVALAEVAIAEETTIGTERTGMRTA